MCEPYVSVGECVWVYEPRHCWAGKLVDVDVSVGVSVRVCVSL